MKTSKLLELQAQIIRHKTAGEHLKLNPNVVLDLIHEVLAYRAEEFGTAPIFVEEVRSLSELGVRSNEAPVDIEDWETEDDPEA